MRESLVGFGHFVGIFAFLDGGTLVGKSVQQFVGKSVCHGCFGTFLSGGNNPADSQSLTTVSADFDRYLISGTADAAGTDFDNRFNILNSFVKNG